MVFGGVRKLFRKKKNRTLSSIETTVSLYSNNETPTTDHSHMSASASSRKLTKRHRRTAKISSAKMAADLLSVNPPLIVGKNAPTVDPFNPETVPHHVVVRVRANRLCNMTDADKNIFKNQFAVSKLPTLPKPTWFTPNPYDQNAEHFKFRFNDAVEDTDTNRVANPPSVNTKSNRLHAPPTFKRLSRLKMNLSGILEEDNVISE